MCVRSRLQKTKLLRFRGPAVNTNHVMTFLESLPGKQISLLITETQVWKKSIFRY